ncbi:CAP domain-containing protein [Noviherbaspirillum malthae]|uniref:CAP domain-containing protein n=1 Tax=Noviherbaspirillum malthae TaxID=1260987 RepID=UPI00188EA139|nr:CAP domain-containing protein [Noviherbaspirillum malthae]
MINEMRAGSRYCGSTLYQPAKALAWNSKLFAAAAGHSTDMATKNYFSHTGLDGRSPSQRVTAAGYNWRTTGENIAAGQKTIADVMKSWNDSPGHCANIMNPNFTEVAVSCVASSNSTYKQYWTMSLGAPR